jgi:hypothetical protein
MLTTDQGTALESFKEWYDDKENMKPLVISGPAGTGKTYLAKMLCDHVYKTSVSAPTHKAALIISESTGIDSDTLQSLYGLSPNFDVENFDMNKMKFGRYSRPKIEGHNLLIIDEGSMISTGLYDYTIETCMSYGVKVVILADSFQLPPVGETVSPIFKGENIVSLKEPVRQSPSNPLILLLTALRCDIAYLSPEGDVNRSYFSTELNNLFIYAEKLGLNLKQDLPYGRIFKTLIAGNKCLTNEDGEGYKISQVDSMIDDAYSSFEVSFESDNYSLVKMIAYTNDRVTELNLGMRRKFFSMDTPFEIGDFIMGYKTVTLTKYQALIKNSVDYKVISVEEDERYDKITGKITGWNIQLESIRTGETTKPFFVVDTVYKEPKNFLLAHEHVHRYSRTNGGKYWKYYFRFKNNYMLLESLNRKYKNLQLPDGCRDIEIFNLPKKDIDYSYAITTHKSQGSTYSEVFVDGNDLKKVMSYARDMSKEEKELFLLKLLYVASSRAKHRASIAL